jgi:hypothetical protein
MDVIERRCRVDVWFDSLLSDPNKFDTSYSCLVVVELEIEGVLVAVLVLYPNERWGDEY